MEFWTKKSLKINVSWPSSKRPAHFRGGPQAVPTSLYLSVCAAGRGRASLWPAGGGTQEGLPWQPALQDWSSRRDLKAEVHGQVLNPRAQHSAHSEVSQGEWREDCRQDSRKMAQNWYLGLVLKEKGVSKKGWRLEQQHSRSHIGLVLESFENKLGPWS